MQLLTTLIASFCLLVTPQMVAARIDYQLVIYAKNAPTGAVDRIMSNSTFLALQLLPLLPGYKLLSPGQYEYRRVLQQKSEGGDGPLLRGSNAEARALPAASQCPASCSSKYSSYCRSCGCYSTSRRRLQDEVVGVLSCTDALLTETLINVELLPYCGLKLFCSINAKVLKLSADGTATPVC